MQFPTVKLFQIYFKIIWNRKNRFSSKVGENLRIWVTILDKRVFWWKAEVFEKFFRWLGKHGLYYASRFCNFHRVWLKCKNRGKRSLIRGIIITLFSYIIIKNLEMSAIQKGQLFCFSSWLPTRAAHIFIKPSADNVFAPLSTSYSTNSSTRSLLNNAYITRTETYICTSGIAEPQPPRKSRYIWSKLRRSLTAAASVNLIFSPSRPYPQ